MASLICDKCGFMIAISGNSPDFEFYSKGQTVHHVVLIAKGNVFESIEAKE